MRYNVPKGQRDAARRLRSEMTGAERRLWHALRRRQLGARFRRQVPVGPFIVDFLSHEARLVLEVDGGQHARAGPGDAVRTRLIEARGFRVLRFWNNEVLGNLEGVLTRISETLATGPGPHPSPPPQAGEGAVRASRVARAFAGVRNGVVTLPYDDRYRRRGLLRTDAGEEVLRDLPEATELRDGDALVLEDGRHILVRAAAEPLTEVRADDPRHLARLAWHMGNRHTPAQVEADRLLIRRDHVIEDMLARLGARLAHVEAPFTPEGGAYGHGRTHAHAHSHDPQHDPDAHLRDRHG